MGAPGVRAFATFERFPSLIATARPRFGTLCVSDLEVLQVLVHLGHCCVSGLKGQLYQPGMKCQVRRP